MALILGNRISAFLVNKINKILSNLSESSQGILDYISESVRPNYQLLMETGVQYEKDAEFIKGMSQEVDSSSRQMKEMVYQVSSSIQIAASTAQESAEESHEIENSVNEVTKAVNDIANSSQNLAEIAEKVSNMVGKFNL